VLASGRCLRSSSSDQNFPTDMLSKVPSGGKAYGVVHVAQIMVVCRQLTFISAFLFSHFTL